MTHEERILKIVYDVLHEGYSIDTTADQDYVYEIIKNRVVDDDNPCRNCQEFVCDDCKYVS